MKDKLIVSVDDPVGITVSADGILGSGTSNYGALTNKPSIETIELDGDKSFEELGLTSITSQEIKNLF